MNTKDHSFTRDGITYDCIARSVGLAKAPRRVYAWRVTVNGVEHASLGYTGKEFSSMASRLEFEAAVVASVAISEQQNSQLRESDLQPLHVSSIRDGRLLEHRDGRQGIARNTDAVGQRVLFEYQANRRIQSEWVRLDDVQVSERSKRFESARGFQRRELSLTEGGEELRQRGEN